MPKGRVLALDIGDRRTGVAVCDEERIISSPLVVVLAKGKKEWLTKIRRVIEDEQVVEVVVGMPLDQYGEQGRDATKIQGYIKLLRKAITVPVVEWDERFTTVQAERALLEADVSRAKRKEVIDKVAASLILQAYLDTQSGGVSRYLVDDEE